MNLSHVEYYLSDILSIMETAQYLNTTVLSVRDLNLIANTLAMDATEYNNYLLNGIQHLLTNDQALPLPPNFFIVGTINLDETTQMLSNKVLDRAHLIKVDTLLPSHSLSNQHFSSTFTDSEMCDNFERIMAYKQTHSLNSKFQEIYDELVTSLEIDAETREHILS
jgi:5-methylcytosine-specific restriction endonuclease McrBC GTP-binding regulatory subunit McrB